MFQLPVSNLTRLRKARKRVKRLLSDIGLDYCKEHVEDYKEFHPDEFYMKNFYLDVCTWDPSWTKSQDYRTKQFCCSDCPFASKYFSAYKNHFRNVHRDDFENRILLNCSYCMYSGNKRTLETHVRLFHMPYNVVRQGIANPLGAIVGGKDMRMDRPMLTNRKELAVYYCKKCNYQDRLYNVVRRHIYREHFQHITTPYVVKNYQKQENSGEATISSHGIHCKSCLFVPRSYEALVQHVVEFHEHVGYQVTAMIGHTSVIVARSQASIVQRGAPVTSGIPPHMVQPVNCFNMPKAMRMPVGNHFKQGVAGSPCQPLCITLPDKALLSSAASQSNTGKNLGSFMVASSLGNATVSPPMKSLPLSTVHATTATLTSLQVKKGLAHNTSLTQKWIICTICNELFSDGAYAIHVEKEHQVERVQAIAKYIMKIHNFTSKCLYCNRYLPSDTLLNHMLIHGLTCSQCPFTFYEVENVVVHKRQMHPNGPVDRLIDLPLTFDLTLQQGSPRNVQLIVTTCNMKEVPKSLSTTMQPPNSVGSRSTIIEAKGTKRLSESLLRKSFQNVVAPNTEMGKVLCPLCFTILKGSISNALTQHLQDQHQVIQTCHPVDKKLTYKCIHCLGVYTSNMTASKITLHLVHCRGVEQSQKVHNKKDSSALKRELVVSNTFDSKKKKISSQSRYLPTIFVEKPLEPVLILDPRGHADESYHTRKAFLTTYFNQQPYPSQQEVEKLAASLWLWKSDVLSHFANQRQSCEQDFVTRKPLVLLGFNMQAVNQLKHEINFDHEWLFTVNNEKKSEISRTAQKKLNATFDFSADKAINTHVKNMALNPGQCVQRNCAFKLSPMSSEPIVTDFHRGSELDTSLQNLTLKTTPIFPTVVQTWTKETVLKERFLYKRGRRVANTDFAKEGSKSLDGATEEATWSGGMSPKDLYRPAGRFEEKGKKWVC